MRLIEHVQFDTVYHEHFSYLSLHTAIRVFASAGLQVYDVEELPTHGGSLRIYGCHANVARGQSHAVAGLLDEEERRGMRRMDGYGEFQERADGIKNALLAFLIDQKRQGRSIAAYGAAAKGNTLLNYAGIKKDLLPYVCDASPSKQGRFLPGSHIPIFPSSAMREFCPELVLILPWNIASEIVAEHEYVREWGARFMVAIPALRDA